MRMSLIRRLVIVDVVVVVVVLCLIFISIVSLPNCLCMGVLVCPFILDERCV